MPLASLILSTAFSSVVSRPERFTKQNEGLRLFAYRDTRGILTVGYGHRVLRGEARTMTIDDAKRTFRRDYGRARLAVAAITTMHDIKPPPLVEVVLVDMAYNLGGSGLSGFHRMLAALAKRDYKTATTELRQSRYALQCPARVDRLCALLLRAGERDS